MSGRHQMEGTVPEMRGSLLAHDSTQIGIELPPDHLDRKIERLDLRQTCAVSLQFFEELRSQLYECRAGARRHQKIVGDDLAHECFEMRLLAGRKRVFEFFLLPVEQPAQLLAASRETARERREPRVREQHDHFRPDIDWRVVIGGVENAKGFDFVRMFYGEIYRGNS